MRLRLLLCALTWAQAVAQFTCTICIGGVGLTKPDGIVTTKDGQTTNCEALTGHIADLPQEACEHIQHIATQPCGCPGYEASRDNPFKNSLITDAREPLGLVPLQSVPVVSASGASPDNPFKASFVTNAREPPQLVAVDSEPGPFVCSICKTGEMKNPTAYTLDNEGKPLTCEQLHNARESIMESDCTRVQSFAAAPCGCDMSAPPTIDSMIEVPDTDGCNVCGDGVIGNPNGIVVNDHGVGRSCAELEANKQKTPANMCASLQNMAIEPCECVFGEVIEENLSVNSNEEVNIPFSPNISLEKTEGENSSSVLEIETVLSKCSICGNGMMTNPDGIVTTRNGASARCDALEANPKQITSGACANIQAMARQPCGCVFQQQEPGVDMWNNPNTFECSICGEGVITIPDGIVTTSEGQAARCNALQENAITIPQEVCPEIQLLSKEACGCTEPEVVTGSETWLGQNTDGSEICHVCGGAAQKVGNPGSMVSTPTGLFTCNSLFNAGLGGSIAMEECSAVQTAVAEKCGCFVDESTPLPSEVYACPICGDGMYATQPEGIPDTENNKTCGQYLVEAAQGKIDKNQCSILQQTSLEACGCQPMPTFPTAAPTSYECQICGEGWEIGSPDAEAMLPSYSKMSCATLQERAETGVIHSSQCARYVPIAQQYCNCIKKPYEVNLAPSTTSYDCNICGSNQKVTNPSGVVVFPNQADRTCIELMTEAAYGKMDQHQCSLLQPYVKQPCGCSDPYTTTPGQSVFSSPVQSPFVSQTAPSPTEEPSDKRGDCFQDLGQIQAMERAVQDTSITRMYVLCPGTTFDIGVWTDEGEINNGQPFIALRPNVIYQCGHDGSRMHNCILKGGDFGLASYDEIYEGIHEAVPGVEIRGLTFESQNLFSVILKSPGDILFSGCAFMGNSNNVPVLMQWEEEEGIESEDSEQLRQVVTFQDCIFRDNFADDSLSFPGIIENTFHSELIVKNSLFKNNIYGANNNLADSGYAIRSFGSLTLESTCFIDNVFLNNGPVLLYGAQYSAYDNYVQSSQRDLRCELGALFSSQDDMAETDPSCEASDANVCTFTQGPTSSPSVAPKIPSVPTQSLREKSTGSSSTTSAETNQASSAALLSGRRSTNVEAIVLPMLLALLLSVHGI